MHLLLTRKYMLSCSFPPSVPSVPQGVTANANSSTSVLVAWMEPAVSFREHMHNCNTGCELRMIHCMYARQRDMHATRERLLLNFNDFVQ